jgi:hypothetical protein
MIEPTGLALMLGDPAGLARRVEALDEVGHDAGHHALEPGVPALLLRVQNPCRWTIQP